MHRRWPLVFLCLLVASPAVAADLRQFNRSQPHMGVEFELVIYAANETAAEPAFEAAFERIAELDKKLSDYSLSSELSLLSATAPTTEPVKLSDDLFTVLQASQQLAAESDGAFDVTIGPLTKLWRRARRQKELPDAELFKSAQTAVGHRYLKVDATTKTATLSQPAMRLDLGGIAKGYAADQALAVLKQKGFPQSLVRASGDIAAGDPPPNEEGWKVAPRAAQPGRSTERFRIAQAAGDLDLRRSPPAPDRERPRYSHLIDPRTGQPLPAAKRHRHRPPRHRC